jgi:ribosomal protein S16
MSAHSANECVQSVQLGRLSTNAILNRYDEGAGYSDRVRELGKKVKKATKGIQLHECTD